MTTDTDTETTDDSIDRRAIRRNIREAIREREAPNTADVVAVAADAVGVGHAAVTAELEKLERHGFVYRFDRDGAEVVKLT